MCIEQDWHKGISVSKNNIKMDEENKAKVISISLPAGPPKAGGSCNPDACKFCWKQCYSRLMAARRKNTLEAYQRNLRLYKNNSDQFFEKIFYTMKLEKPDLFRFFVGGDFPDQRFVDLSIEVSKQVDTSMLAFTKTHFGSHNFSFKGRPANYEIILSAWPGMPIKRRRGMRIAWMQDCQEDRIPTNAFQCNGNCIDCRYCWGKKNDVWFPIHGGGITKKKKEAIQMMKGKAA